MQQKNQMKSIAARVTITAHALTPRESGGWWLAITWRAHNDGDSPLYLLVTGPGPYVDATPLLLDHTIEPADPALSELAPRPIAFRVIAPSSFIDLPERYALPAWDFAAPRQVIGRFGVNIEPPGEGWERSLPWERIMEWQQPLESETITVRAPGG